MGGGHKNSNLSTCLYEACYLKEGKEGVYKFLPL
jgi:hypothetical protein